MTAAAQDGAALALLYRAQGPRQQGDSLVLLYGGSVEPLRKRIATGFGLPWGAAAVQDVPQRAPFAITTPTNVSARAPWGSGRSAQHNTRPVWGVADRQDRDKRAPWGAYARRSARAATAPWGAATRRDEQATAPWGIYARRVALQPGFFWLLARPQDEQATAPWGAYARRPVRNQHTAWRRARPADGERHNPWTRFSRALAPGWGVVVPGGEIPVDEYGTVIVPIRSVYLTVNTLTLTRASDGALIPCAALGMSLDVDSWTWQWQATLHADALLLITPGPGGDPVDVLATVNGTPYRLAVEAYTRSRQFGSTRIAVRGRGRAAVLDAPYAPSLNHGNAATGRTAQQLMGDVLTVNGVPIGWDVDFGLTDWLVPAGAWALQGPYIAAILDIAGAAGGYVQPHDTAQTLRVLPRYPAAPWDWASLTPHFELPASVVAVEGTEWTQKPAYNRVHVSGTTAGVLGEVTRTGTAGDVVAPMATHPLITTAAAARQRGIAELANTGRQARLSLRLPVLDETGVIKPGAFVRYVDNGVPQLGLVRSTQIEWARPTLRQVLAVETHPDYA